MVEFEIIDTQDKGSEFSVDVKYWINEVEKSSRVYFSKESYISGDWKKSLVKFLEKKKADVDINVDLNELKNKKIKSEEFEPKAEMATGISVEELS